MAARDGASSVQGVALRATRLNLDGSVDPNYPVLTTKGFISASFASEYEEGDEITEKAADGSVCISWKADDSLTRLTFNLSLCSPDPEAAALLAGGEVICAPADSTEVDGSGNPLVKAGEIVGYTSPPVGAVAGNPVAVEIWSVANVGGKPAAGTPYWHWAFPYVKIRYEGDREFTNGALTNEFTGQALGNSALAEGLGLPSIDPTPGDFSDALYGCSLINPFSYVRTAKMPSVFGFSEPWGAGCVDCLPGAGAATGATAGSPGTWTPAGSDAPADAAAAEAAGIAATPNAAWATGEYMQGSTAGAAGEMFWDSAAWTAGRAT